jgi:MOSC domain-containing protein YiiM
MDAICPGLRKLMEPDRQGVLAQVVRSGRIRTGDAIRVLRRPVDATPGLSDL